MIRLNRLFLRGLVVLSLLAFGLAGCGNSNDTEPAGKHDTPEMKEKRQDKKGD